MTRDDIIRMAKEAGAFFDGDCSCYDMPEHCFERFAALVATAEREACAEICRAYAMPDGTSITAMVLEKAIRARGKT